MQRFNGDEEDEAADGVEETAQTLSLTADGGEEEHVARELSEMPQTARRTEVVRTSTTKARGAPIRTTRPRPRRIAEAPDGACGGPAEET